MVDRKAGFFFRKFVTWIFRRRDPEVIIIKAALVPLGAVVFGLVSRFSLLTEHFHLEMDLGDLDLIGKVVVIGLLFVILVCICLAWRRFSRTQDRLDKKRVFVIEGRGLRDDDGKSLSKIARAIAPGFQIPMLLDLRQKIDETIVVPEKILPRIFAMRQSLNQQKAGNGIDNSKVVYGGLTSVPFTVMTGIELDDEGKVEVVDWDRAAENWRRLDDEDDGKSFNVSGMGAIVSAKRVVMAISVSYPITDEDIETTFNMPVIRLSLEGASSDAHWSKDKQSRLAVDFFEIAKTLKGKGVKEIHLVLASPNSMSFNIGRRYDRRNLPDLFIYQYERLGQVKYPWCVKVPTIGQTPSIKYTNTKSDGFADSKTS